MTKTKASPNYLPQVNIPYNIVLEKLDEENIGYDLIDIDPNELNPLQPFVFSDDVDKCEIDDNNPIWVAGDDINICDGHHRFLKALNNNKNIKAVHIHLNPKVACRLLNKIVDIYEYEQAQNVEEIVGNDVINDENDINNNYTDSSEFLSELEEENTSIETELPSKNTKTIIAYRKEPIKENSVVGNFFSLKPIDGYGKYEIEFDNLYDTNEFGVTYKESQQPIDILAKIWFPNINFEKISGQHNIPINNLKSRAIAEKAIKLGFDGVKYGDSIIQGLK
jgi:hypothetical protein